MFVKIITARLQDETLYECESVRHRVCSQPGYGDGAGEAQNLDAPQNFMEVQMERPSGAVTVWLERGALSKKSENEPGPNRHQIYVMNDFGKTIESIYW